MIDWDKSLQYGEYPARLVHKLKGGQGSFHFRYPFMVVVNFGTYEGVMFFNAEGRVTNSANNQLRNVSEDNPIPIDWEHDELETAGGYKAVFLGKAFIDNEECYTIGIEYPNARRVFLYKQTGKPHPNYDPPAPEIVRKKPECLCTIRIQHDDGRDVTHGPFLSSSLIISTSSRPGLYHELQSGPWINIHARTPEKKAN